MKEGNLRHTILLALLLFVLVFFSHAKSPIAISTDSIWSLYVAESILREGNIDLDEYRDTVRAHSSFGIRKKRGHIYNYFPLGTTLLALPFVWVCDIYNSYMAADLPGAAIESNRAGSIDPRVTTVLAARSRLECTIASFYVAFAALFVFLSAARSSTPRLGFLAAVVFAFCTSAWSTASRGLWQHGPSLFLLAGALYWLLCAKEKQGFLIPAGVFLGFSYVVRPSNLVSLVAFTIYIAIVHREALIRYAIAVLCVLLPFFLFNENIFGSILPPYYRSARLSLGWSFIEAAAANLVSPNRGLFVFSPILLLCVYGVIARIDSIKNTVLEWTLISIFCCHLGLISLFPGWWGGHSYGPRFMTDMLPYLMYFIVFAFERIPSLPLRTRIAVMALSLLLACFSFYVHCRGAFSTSVHAWNRISTDIDDNPSKVWDWKRMQIFAHYR